jgi:methylase of polypeptide subunit release factors
MRLLKPGGVVGCEHGDDQSELVAEILDNMGFHQVTLHLDLNDRPRFTTAMKPNME